MLTDSDDSHFSIAAESPVTDRGVLGHLSGRPMQTSASTTLATTAWMSFLRFAICLASQPEMVFCGSCRRNVTALVVVLIFPGSYAMAQLRASGLKSDAVV